jgi:hypothetical protein
MSSHKPVEWSNHGDSSRAWLEETDADPRRLAELLRPTKKLFASSDLGQMLTHQLGAALHFPESELETRLAQALAALSPEQRTSLRTFGDLLGRPRPPAELLLLLKDFAKGMLKHPDTLMPQKLARALYFTAIAAARIQGLERFTELDEEGVRKGMAWALEQAWLGEPCRGLLVRGMAQSSIAEP